MVFLDSASEVFGRTGWREFGRYNPYSPEILSAYAHAGELDHSGVRFERPGAWSSELWVAPVTADVVRFLQVKVAEGQDASPFRDQNGALLSDWQVGDSEMIRLFLILISCSVVAFLAGWK